MSDEDKDSKTEDPSQKKLDDAHKKGDVAKSQEVTTWFMLLGVTGVFASLSPWVASELNTSLSLVLMNVEQIDVSAAGFADFISRLVFSILGIMLVPLV